MICCAADLRGDRSAQIVSWLGISRRHGPFVQFQRTIFFYFFCTSSSKRAVITPVHFGSRFTFFHQLGQMLTRCTLSSFLGQIVFIFSRHSNPNRRFHLFSFGESVFSGIFSGSKIIWKGVSFLFLLHLLPARGAHKSYTMSDGNCRDSPTDLAAAAAGVDKRR